VHLVGFIIRI